MQLKTKKIVGAGDIHIEQCFILRFNALSLHNYTQLLNYHSYSSVIIFAKESRNYYDCNISYPKSPSATEAKE